MQDLKHLTRLSVLFNLKKEMIKNMAMVYTQIFADKIDERFISDAVSQKIVNNDYSFVGAKTVKVTSINTVDNRGL